MALDGDEPFEVIVGSQCRKSGQTCRGRMLLRLVQMHGNR